MEKYENNNNENFNNVPNLLINKNNRLKMNNEQEVQEDHEEEVEEANDQQVEEDNGEEVEEANDQQVEQNDGVEVEEANEQQVEQDDGEEVEEANDQQVEQDDEEEVEEANDQQVRQDDGIKNKDHFFLEGGAKQKFEIDLETISNNPLLDSERIKNKAEEYLNNYYSNEYTKYNDNLELFYKKMKKNEYLKHEKNFIYIIKSSKIKKEKEKEIILDKIKKPKYQYISKRIFELETLIKNYNIKVVNMFNNMKSKVISNPNEIKIFKKEKSKYVSLLEEKEILELYYRTINKIDINEINKDVIYQNKNVKTLNSKDIILESKLYKISNETVNNINVIQSERLNQYNDIMVELKKDKVDADTKKKIIDYLSNKELKNIITKNKSVKEIQDQYIDYIVIEKP